MKKQPVLWFYILAFAISWLGWLPMVAGSRGMAPFEHPLFQVWLLLPAVGPALAAVMVTAANDGKTGVDPWPGMKGCARANLLCDQPAARRLRHEPPDGIDTRPTNGGMSERI